MKIPQIHDIQITPLSLNSIFECIPQRDEIFALLKTSGKISGHGFSLLGMHPYLIARAKGRRCSLETAHGIEWCDEDPFQFLQKIFDASHFDLDEYLHFCGGAIGAFSYDLKEMIEEMPSYAREDVNLPDLIFVFFRNYVLFDEVERKAWKIEVIVKDHEPCTMNHKIWKKTDADSLRNERFFRNASRDLSSFRETESQRVSEKECRVEHKELSSNFTEIEYLHAVKKIIHHIHEGDIYQANISQRFGAAPFSADSFLLFRVLEEINPAPMMAYLQFPEATLISTSPERFLKREGTRVITSPIKGTRPRGKTDDEDEKLQSVLWNSSKDGAELAMIVDLMRNDLGKLAIPGSVKVTDPKRIEAYTNVFHLVATIEAQLDPSISSFDVIRSCFPAGSITGCPKLRAMEMIEGIEPVKRGFAYGSLGYVAFNGDFDLNVAIRTIIMKERKLFFHLGGGIVADSDPKQEYEETLQKGKSMFEILKRINI